MSIYMDGVMDPKDISCKILYLHLFYISVIFFVHVLTLTFQVSIFKNRISFLRECKLMHNSFSAFVCL
jgi:hypothetical protein